MPYISLIHTPDKDNQCGIFCCCCKRLLLFEMGLVTVDGRGTRYRSLAYKQGKLKSLSPVAVYMYLFATCLHINKCTHIVTWTHFFGKAHQMVFLFNTLVKNINMSFQLSDQEVTKLSFLLNMVLHFCFQPCRRT